MKLQRRSSSTTAGTWLLYLQAGDELVEFCVRPLSPSTSRAISAKYEGVQQQMTVTRHGQVLKLDPEALFRATIDRACHALVDSRNADLEMADQETADAFGKLLGRPVAAGETVRLDGAWTPELKREVLRDYLELVSWLIEHAQRLAAGAASREEAAAGES